MSKSVAKVVKPVPREYVGFHRVNGQLKMLPEYKEKLLKSLDQKIYKKGLGALRQHGKWCCLGVWAHVCIGVKWRVKHEYDSTTLVIEKSGKVGYLPEKMMPMSVQRQLSEINDKSPNWEPVKKWIEENL